MCEYSTDLTDNQLQVIEKIINAQERARKHSLRDIMNAILYINKTGCQWRLLPREFGPWQTVYYYFRKWKFEGVFDDTKDTLGLRMAVAVHEANLHDSKGVLSDSVKKLFPE